MFISSSKSRIKIATPSANFTIVAPPCLLPRHAHVEGSFRRGGSSSRSFRQVWRQASNYSAGGQPRAWIINIARSRAIDKIRSIRRMEKSFVSPTIRHGRNPSDNVESSAAESETRLTMNAALANLPETQRRV
jgi:hypothetical protein